MKEHTPAPGTEGANGFRVTPAPPVEVFYIVQSTGDAGERNHCLRSVLFESRAQAGTELARMRAVDPGGNYTIWKSATYIEPAEWLHRVVRSDGSLILPRIPDVEKLTDA